MVETTPKFEEKKTKNMETHEALKNNIEAKLVDLRDFWAKTKIEIVKFLNQINTYLETSPDEKASELVKYLSELIENNNIGNSFFEEILSEKTDTQKNRLVSDEINNKLSVLLGRLSLIQTPHQERETNKTKQDIAQIFREECAPRLHAFSLFVDEYQRNKLAILANKIDFRNLPFVSEVCINTTISVKIERIHSLIINLFENDLSILGEKKLKMWQKAMDTAIEKWRKKRTGSIPLAEIKRRNEANQVIRAELQKRPIAEAFRFLKESNIPTEKGLANLGDNHKQAEKSILTLIKSPQITKNALLKAELEELVDIIQKLIESEEFLQESEKLEIFLNQMHPAA